MITKKDMKKIKPLKKKHKGLKIFLIVLCVILVLPIAFIFGAFYDPTTKNVSNTEVHYENVVSRAFNKSLSELSSDNPKLGFSIDEEMIDGIMMAACEKINQPKYVPKMYCYINDNNYTFVMDAQISFFKTRALIHTMLDKDGEGFDETLTFKITGITLGRLPVPLNWVTGILGNFMNDETLNNAFGQSGFHIQSHLKEAKLTYSRAQFKQDVGGYISELGRGDSFLNMILDIFSEEAYKILETDFYNGVSATFNLSKLQIEEGTYKKPPLVFSQLEDHRKAIVGWLNSGDLKEENVPNMFSYLMRGDTDKSFITSNPGLKAKVENYIKPETLDNYKGSSVSNSQRFIEYYDNKQIDASFNPNDLEFYITSGSINKFLAGTITDVIGKTIPITNTNDDGTWNFYYITIDNLYTEFKNNTSDPNNPFMNFYINLNISGVPFTIKFETKDIKITDTKTSTDTNEWQIGNLSFSLKNINFGNIQIKEQSYIDEILKLLPQEGDLGFVYDKETKSFKISLDKIRSVRKIFEDDISENMRDAILNAIKVASSQSDLLDRSVVEDETDVNSEKFILDINTPQP